MKNNNTPLVQQILGSQWHQLPEALKNHYRENDKGENFGQGHLTIEYPSSMQWILNILYFCGALLNRRGKHLPTSVHRSTHQDQQQWQRSVVLADGSMKTFNSTVVLDRNNDCLIEYVNGLMGVRLRPFVDDDKLRYESQGYVVKMGRFLLPIPEWLALGHISIVESQSRAGDHDRFDMDFSMKHALFGELYRYSGQFVSSFSGDL